ncbi:hypothetical protein B9Z55_004784 [Caenorhabditis nigoni]|uniref:MGS-like domain-containing protein n=1 Tax=Caenorhabditis nigoni TaxID=1611254 RepID=A0A2G5UY10_9PELO|nr:hypothetical protein B9Z55_004784 [Caenorhabditis nigoni]
MIRLKIVFIPGTADYFQSNKIDVKPVDWSFEEGSSDEKTASGTRSVVEFLENKEFHLVINLPIRGSSAYRVSAFRTHGYKTRRMAIDNGIPLITEIKCAKTLVQALAMVGRRPTMNSLVDCVTSKSLKRLPEMIDIHVHVREPGATENDGFKKALVNRDAKIRHLGSLNFGLLTELEASKEQIEKSKKDGENHEES